MIMTDKAYYNTAMSPKDVEEISLYQKTKSLMSEIHNALLMGSFSKNDFVFIRTTADGKEESVKKDGYSLLIPYMSRSNFSQEVHDELQRTFKKAKWAGVVFIQSNIIYHDKQIPVCIDGESLIYRTTTYPPIGFLLVLLVK